MSAWSGLANSEDTQRIVTLDKLAPKFREALLATLSDLRASEHDPRVFETLRTDALQRVYYDRGTSKAPTANRSWHGYGLAADVISFKHEWDSGEFFKALGAAAKRHGLAWGGDFVTFPDPPHVQWGAPMRPSPSARAIELKVKGGNEAVWREVGAL